ncbi:MAG: glutathione S-transferase family protein [Pseudomonadota bacterium]
MQNTVMIYGPAFSSYVRSVMLCCEEVEIPYELVKPSKEELPHPFGKVPVLIDGDVTIFETAAICRYLDRRSNRANLSSSDIRQLAWMDQWISAANCYFDPTFIRRLVLEIAFPTGANGEIVEANIASVLPEVDHCLGVADAALATYPYFSGMQPGIADYLIMPMIDYLHRCKRVDDLLGKFARMTRYYEGMRLRPSCRKILVAPRLIV